MLLRVRYCFLSVVLVLGSLWVLQSAGRKLSVKNCQTVTGYRVRAVISLPSSLFTDLQIIRQVQQVGVVLLHLLLITQTTKVRRTFLSDE